MRIIRMTKTFINLESRELMYFNLMISFQNWKKWWKALPKIALKNHIFFRKDFNQSRPGTGHFVGRKEVSGNSKQFSWKVFMSSKPWSWKVYNFFEKSFGKKKLPRQVLPYHSELIKSENKVQFLKINKSGIVCLLTPHLEFLENNFF